MNRLRISILLIALLAGSCERLAGTEVGNPEITMNARFSIRDTDPTADVPEFNLKMMEMGWTAIDHSEVCWNTGNGHVVDFAANAMPLDEIKVSNSEWKNAEITLHTAPGSSALPVSTGFAKWHNPRYAKIVKVMGADTVRALFQMPEKLKLRLIFGKATINTWRQQNGIIVEVKFDVGTWSAGLGSKPDFKFRTDGNRARYVVLSPNENAAVYKTMKELLPKAFVADSTNVF
ncbi:MAG: hypothetical protein ABIW76_02765 [Fibrobacteria bacterium]